MVDIPGFSHTLQETLQVSLYLPGVVAEHEALNPITCDPFTFFHRVLHKHCRSNPKPLAYSSIVTQLSRGGPMLHVVGMVSSQGITLPPSKTMTK